jgi:hypothetical protein
MSEKETSESRYGLPKQPPDTCPILNSVMDECERSRPSIEGVTASMLRAIRRAESSEDYQTCIDDLIYLIEQAEEAMGDIDYSRVEKYVDQARDNAAAIREWGQSWKDLAKENIAKIEAIKTPWDGVVLWWRERCKEKWHETWLYKTCFAPTISHPKVAII